MPKSKDAPTGAEMPTLQDMNVSRLEDERYRCTWSYMDVTAMAEDMIRRLRGAEGDLRDRDRYRERAYGVYLGWDALTAGMQRQEDNERLLRMTE